MRTVHDLALQATLCVDATLQLLALQDPDASPTADELAAAVREAGHRARTLRGHLGALALASEPEQVAADGKRLIQAIKDEAYPFESPLHGIYAEARSIGFLQVHDRRNDKWLAELLWQEADPKARRSTATAGGWAIEAAGKRFPVATLPDLLTILRVLRIQ